MKSTEKMNLFTFTNTSSMILLEHFMDRSTNCNKIMVGFSSPDLSFLKIKNGIKLALVPKSHKILQRYKLLTVQGNVNLPNPFYLVGFYNMALHPLVNIIVFCSFNLLFFNMISFKNLAYLSICSKVLINGM